MRATSICRFIQLLLTPGVVFNLLSVFCRYIRLLLLQLCSAPLSEVSKFLLGIGLNLPAKQRTIRSQAEGADQPAGLCHTYSSLRNTGDVLLAVCSAISCRSVNDDTEDALRRSILLKVSAFLTDRLDFSGSDATARNIYVDQLFLAGKMFQRGGLSATGVFTTLARCLGVLAQEHGILSEAVDAPIVPAMFGVVHDGQQPTPRNRSAAKEQFRSCRQTLMLCVHHASELWLLRRATGGLSCGEYTLIGDGKDTGFASVLRTRLSAHDHVQKEIVQLLSHLFEVTSRESQEAIDLRSSSIENPAGQDDDSENFLDDIMANIDMEEGCASVAAPVSSEDSKSRQELGLAQADQRLALARTCQDTLMDLLRTIINSRAVDAGQQKRCSYELWCRTVRCLSWATVLMCQELSYGPAEVVQYFPLSNWHIEHHKQKRQLPVKVLGILTSSKSVASVLESSVEVVNLWCVHSLLLKATSSLLYGAVAGYSPSSILPFQTKT